MAKRIETQSSRRLNREAYGVTLTTYILFNDESPMRCETFVTHEIKRAFARIALELAPLPLNESQTMTRPGKAKLGWTGENAVYARVNPRLINHAFS